MQLYWYFAYGSNMNPERLINERLAPEGAFCRDRILGKLQGWKLVFDKPSAYFIGAAAANIKLQAESCVLGTLNLVCAKRLDILDRYENVATKQYERASVRVIRPDSGELVDAVTYTNGPDL
jgi:gamma-glutamylcyclotransferase